MGKPRKGIRFIIELLYNIQVQVASCLLYIFCNTIFKCCQYASELQSNTNLDLAFTSVSHGDRLSDRHVLAKFALSQH